MESLSRAILPAVDKAIAIGLADSAAIFVIGHSFGGFAVYSLLAQTTRFRAAVVSSAPGDLMSFYGQFIAPFEYSADGRGRSFSAVLLEGGQFEMGAPFGTGGVTYMRNNPILRLDQVKTPLLIMQGEQDFVSPAQGEEWFTGLWRLGRDVCFVRYIGEQHLLQSPANIRDKWIRVLSWLAAHEGARSDTPVLNDCPQRTGGSSQASELTNLTGRASDSNHR